MGERPLILDIIDQWEQEIDEIVESDIPELALDEKISELEEHIDEHLEDKFIIIKDDIYILKPKVDYSEEINCYLLIFDLIDTESYERLEDIDIEYFAEEMGAEVRGPFLTFDDALKELSTKA